MVSHVVLFQLDTMKLLLCTLACLLATVFAVNYDEVLPIEAKFLRNPYKYPLLARFYTGANIGIFSERQGRITGGQEATPGQFPYQAAMFVTASGGTYFCGGTILDANTVMTAAHCVDE